MDEDLWGLEYFVGLDLWIEFFLVFYLIAWVQLEDLIFINEEICEITHNSINNHHLHNIRSKYSLPKIILPIIRRNFHKNIRQNHKNTRIEKLK